MEWIGYHGTTREAAENIVEKKMKYRISCSNKEWLGRGIYFYVNISDARQWRNSFAVLRSVIWIKQSEYIDYDTEKGRELFVRAKQIIEEYAQGKLLLSAEEAQCVISNMIWDSNPQVKLMAATFPNEPRKGQKTIFDYRKKRREFCVRDNDCIIKTELVQQEE